MRRTGLWHPRLAALVTGMGHGDLLVIADPGLPVPSGVESVDLVYTRGAPGLVDVLHAVLGDFVVEHATLASELADEKMRDDIVSCLGTTPTKWVPHDELKAMTSGAVAVVRTGEDTPFANVVLRAGVPF